MIRSNPTGRHQERVRENRHEAKADPGAQNACVCGTAARRAAPDDVIGQCGRADTYRCRHPVSEHEILQLHELVLQGIDSANAGRYRDVAVRIAGTTVVLPNPHKVPELMAELGDWLRARSRLHPVAVSRLVTSIRVVRRTPSFRDSKQAQTEILRRLCAFALCYGLQLKHSSQHRSVCNRAVHDMFRPLRSIIVSLYEKPIDKGPSCTRSRFHPNSKSSFRGPDQPTAARS